MDKRAQSTLEREELLMRMRVEWEETHGFDEDSEEGDHLHILLNESFNAGAEHHAAALERARAEERERVLEMAEGIARGYQLELEGDDTWRAGVAKAIADDIRRERTTRGTDTEEED